MGWGGGHTESPLGGVDAVSMLLLVAVATSDAANRCPCLPPIFPRPTALASLTADYLEVAYKSINQRRGRNVDANMDIG